MSKFRFRERFRCLIRSLLPGGRFKVKGVYKFRALRADGSIKWEEEIHNIVVNVALNHILDVVLKGGTPVTTWYIGLKNTGSPAAGDTMASHGGWSELTAYSNANRPTWTGGSVSNQAVDNTGSPAAFTINANGTVIYGAFLTSNNTKGGTTGTLFSVGNFSTAKTLDSGEILEVTITYVAADDGI